MTSTEHRSEQEPETQAALAAGGSATWARTVVVGAAVLAVLLVGAAVGLLVGLPGSDQRGAPSTGSVDVGFSQDMSVHHLQAVEMAAVCRDRSVDQTIRQIAFDIERTQLEQVGRMKGWLTLWQQPEQGIGEYMTWMTGVAGHTHGGSASAGTGVDLMPGMASQQELSRLRSLSGRDLDIYFLQLMLRHHVGGAPMAAYAAEHAGQNVVRTLADNILKSQAAEATTMRRLLAERGGQELPEN